VADRRQQQRLAAIEPSALYAFISHLGPFYAFRLATLLGQEGSSDDWQERTMSLRQRQEIQEVLRRMNA
jgi:hypothetical protein